MDLLSKIRDGGIWADQGEIAGCAGGTYDNLCAAAGLLRGKSIGNGTFSLNLYPGSMPILSALIKSGKAADLITAGAVLRECFCGPCFGAGDTPANGEFSIRHTTRNFPNRGRHGGQRRAPDGGKRCGGGLEHPGLCVRRGHL